MIPLLSIGCTPLFSNNCEQQGYQNDQWSCTLDLFPNSWLVALSQPWGVTTILNMAHHGTSWHHFSAIHNSPSGRMLVMVTMRMARASLPMRSKRKRTGFTGRFEAHRMVISITEVAATWAANHDTSSCL